MKFERRQFKLSFLSSYNYLSALGRNHSFLYSFQSADQARNANISNLC
jgi:hypothetical protein